MHLPDTFVKNMEALFARRGALHELPAFFDSFDREPQAVIRFNTDKVEAESACQAFCARYHLPALKRVPWSTEAWYLPKGFAPAQTVEYLQGLFYLQEASALLPGMLVEGRGTYLLDLCAAPGGKSTKICNQMQKRSTLICNEISLDRARILLRNLEQWGSTRASVTHATAQNLADQLPPIFDEIILDAPCSGEGMFSRDPRAIQSWETYNSQHCQTLQAEILDAAAALLRPGGRLIYSTCTFNWEENEGQIEAFLQRHPQFTLLPVREKLPKIAQEMLGEGIPSENRPELIHCLRIWPHLVEGEGHFCAVLQFSSPQLEGEKKEQALVEESGPPKKTAPQCTQGVSGWILHDLNLESNRSFAPAQDRRNQRAARVRRRQSSSPHSSPNCSGELARTAWEEFSTSVLDLSKAPLLFSAENSQLLLERNYLHLIPSVQIDLPFSGIHWLKRGLLLGEVVQGKQPRLHPTQALAQALPLSCVRSSRRYVCSEAEALAYLAGHTLLPREQGQEKTGYLLLTWEDHPLGWVRAQGGSYKNLYPLSWVRNLRSPWEEQGD